ncbi:unnamed protein product (macronuclear) [Paramecium tetraurelia]|uniref:Uncharacterized protein n=1 Tax=Paramecium tetraurelia TaxID=5888 RepID=A0D5T4_PARTE|nr:uncharacterized protein GSPATT00013831001 [Paramecium tetraurelia]CAK78401.1 unnamed protein product [Paramecium tetraurelia]|eukprot:XP_001445798.1 hypothetical protein (macronuclear) [Paramecium tetraurelia strain d4-2]
MINQRVYIRATARKQQNQPNDDFYGEQQYDDEVQQYDSLLNKRTQKEFLNEESKSKKTLYHFDISNQQWNPTLQQNTQNELVKENSVQLEENFEQYQNYKQKGLQLFKIDDFSVLEINEINYIEQFQGQKDYQLFGKKHKQNISKKIYKYVC